jgi:hydroxymethylglutaryl-CoA reductase (NADPH)
MRALIRPVSVHAASSPIETIVFFFVVATLAYFQVLSAVKHSSFFAPSTPTPLRPSHALWRGNEWVTVPETEWYDALAHRSSSAIDLQPLSMSFDTKTAKKARTAFPSNIAPTNSLMQIAENPMLSSQVTYSLENVTHFLTHHFPTSSGKSYTDICHTVQTNQDGEEACFTSTFSSIPKAESLTLSFAAGGREDFVSALAKQGSFISEEFGPIKYVIENPEQEANAAMKSGKWVGYAARALIVRFWDLTKVSMAQFICRQEFPTLFLPESGQP